MFDSLINDMVCGIRERNSLPKMPDELSIEDAYGIQKRIVAKAANGKVAGLKAGMTAAAGQKAFGLTHPLIGSLYSWGELTFGAIIEHQQGVRIECEIGVRIDAKGKPLSAGPVIEIPRIAWATPDDAKGANLAACNIAADRFIVGEQHPIRVDYLSLGVKLTRDDEVVCEAPLSDALGGPMSALEWMLNEANVRGLSLAEGMLLITGACGGIHPAERGFYVANYGELGSIEFSVK